MSLIKLQFQPGIDRDRTNYSGEGGWWECDKIRFQSGFPEKIGGWTKRSPYTFYGVCRQMWNWITSYGDNLLAMGTNNKLYLEIAGYYYDITPLRDVDPVIASPITNNSISTGAGLQEVVFNLTTAHNMVDEQFVTISGVTGNPGGIADANINGNHKVKVIDADSFSIIADAAALTTATGVGGTTITIEVEIAPGPPIATNGYGWGVGTWGRDTWGLGSQVNPVIIPQRDWWLDNIDNDLVANIRNGPPYYWARGASTDIGVPLAERAVPLQDIATDGGYDPAAVPSKVGQLMVSQNDKHLIAFGAVPYGFTDPDDFDPLLIRWSDQDIPGQWTPEIINSAGDIRVSRGSRIVRALPTRQEILVWTDSTLYTMQFLGTTDVYSLQEYSDNISIISPRAVASASDVTYWMGIDKFYAHTGRVETLPCTLHTHVFDDINLNQREQIICGTNEKYDEVWWFYPTADSDWNNAYVVLNHVEKAWYYGRIERTAWLDTAYRAYPHACASADNGETGLTYEHESGLDADGEPMLSFIQSNDFDLGDGDQFMLTRKVIPDVRFVGSTAVEPSVLLQLKPRDFPGNRFIDDPADTQRVVETDVSLFTNQVFIRARGRQMALRIISAGLGVQWQLGSPRVELRPDGRRS